MNSRSLLALAVLASLAGCLGEAAAPESTGTMETESVAPVVATLAPPFTAQATHSFLEESASVPIEIPAGLGDFEVRVTTEPAGTPIGPFGCSSLDARTILLDPAGALFLEVNHGLGLSPGGDRCVSSGQSWTATLAPGTWSAEFSGRGTFRATLAVVQV